MLPFARELTSMGTEVILAANSIASIDVQSKKEKIMQISLKEEKHKPRLGGSHGVTHNAFLLGSSLTTQRGKHQVVNEP